MVFVGDRTCLFVRAKSKNIGCDPPAGATLTELINDLLNTAVGIGIVGLIDV